MLRTRMIWGLVLTSAVGGCGRELTAAYCIIAFQKTGIDPISQATVEIKDGNKWPKGCACLDPNDGAEIEAIQSGTQAVDQEYENTVSVLASRAEAFCNNLGLGLGLVQIDCDIDLDCLEAPVAQSDFLNCTALAENFFEGSAGGGTGSIDPCTSGGESGFATGEINTSGFGYEPTGSYPSPYEMGDAIDCPSSTKCFIDETFLAELATTPTLIDDDNAVIEFSVDGLELIDVPNGSIAHAFGFVDGDIVTDVSGYPLTSLDDVSEAFVGVAYEEMLKSITVTYKRPPSPWPKTLAIGSDDLATYP